MRNFCDIDKKLVLFMLIMTCYNQSCKFFEWFFLQIFLPVHSSATKNNLC